MLECPSPKFPANLAKPAASGGGGLPDHPREAPHLLLRVAVPPVSRPPGFWPSLAQACHATFVSRCRMVLGGCAPPLLSSSLSDSRPYTGTCAALQSRSCSSSSSTVACGGAPARGDLAPVRRSPCLGPSLCCAGWADGTWGFLIPPSSLLPVYDEVNEVAFHSLDRLLLEVKFLLPPVQAGGGAAPPICFPARFQHGAALDGPKHGPPPTCDIDHDRWKS